MSITPVNYATSVLNSNKPQDANQLKKRIEDLTASFTKECDPVFKQHISNFMTHTFKERFDLILKCDSYKEQSMEINHALNETAKFVIESKIALLTLIKNPEQLRSQRTLCNRSREDCKKGTVNIINDAFTENLKEVEIVLRLVDSGRPIESITEEDVKNELEKEIQIAKEKAEENRKKTIQDLESEKTTPTITVNTSPKKKKQVKGKNKQVNAKPREETTEEIEIIQPPVKPQIDPVVLRQKYAQEIKSRNLTHSLPRVTERWKSQIQEIKNFVDFSDGNKIMRYKNLSDSELHRMRFFHYLPGTEKIFANENDRNIYCFKTKTGLGMYAEIEYTDPVTSHNEKLTGVIYYGIDGQKIFHCCLEPLKPYRFIDALGYEPEQINDDVQFDNGDYHCKNQYTLEVNEKGIIHIKYSQYGHSVNIHPARRYLLEKTYPELYPSKDVSSPSAFS